MNSQQKRILTSVLGILCLALARHFDIPEEHVPDITTAIMALVGVYALHKDFRDPPPTM
jgi:hypothetical protein